MTTEPRNVHELPTVTSTGRVVLGSYPGPADTLTGWRRLVETWERLRVYHSRRSALRILRTARRSGYVLSGSSRPRWRA